MLIKIISQIKVNFHNVCYFLDTKNSRQPKDYLLNMQKSFPLIFEFLLLLIYALNIILNGNFEPVFPPIISFIKILVAENVAKSLAELCQVVVR